nr:peritrophin-44-like isoform X2 [Aedes albopictus]
MFVLRIATLSATLFALFPSNVLAEECHPFIQCHPTITHVISDPDACYRYISCYQGRATVITCPPGHKFVLPLQSCFPARVEDCFPCPETGTSFFPHPNSCQKYVTCYMGAAYEMSCPDGYFFDPAAEMCDEEVNVDCAI